MKRSTAAWTVTVTAAALLALPVAAAAQSATPSTPTTQSTAQPPATATTGAQSSAAQEHLSHARTALNDVTIASLSVGAKTQVAELKRRLGTLERNSKAASKTWATEVAAMDKILAGLLANEATPTGTSGTTPAAERAKGKAAATVALDEANRAKLTEVRTALTAYAAAMSGQPAPSSETAAATSAPSATATTAATPTTPPTEPAAAATAAAPAAEAQKVDEDAAKRALTEARNTLSALTQLPAAAQLTGDARTQVSQLISNFNELITTKTEWRASYAKVAANLTALLGPDTVEPAAAASGTAGAVGTSGSAAATIDPAVRAKLAELRKNLADFERASGGATAGATATPATPPAEPTTAPPSATTPPTTTAPPTAPPAATAAPAASAPTAHAESMRLIAAIETMLKMENEGGGLTLDKTQAETLRTHLAELKKLLDQAKK